MDVRAITLMSLMRAKLVDDGLVYAIGKIGVLWVGAQILKQHDGDGIWQRLGPARATRCSATTASVSTLAAWRAAAQLFLITFGVEENFVKQEISQRSDSVSV